jgi:hypothetical protein
MCQRAQGHGGDVEFWKPSYGNTYWPLPLPPHWQIGGVFITGVRVLLTGVIHPPFFKGETLNKDTPVLVPDN